MTTEIKPTADGGCSLDECPSYDGKRCSLTGFRPRSCEPAYRALLSQAEAGEEMAAAMKDLIAAAEGKDCAGYEEAWERLRSNVINASAALARWEKAKGGGK